MIERRKKKLKSELTDYSTKASAGINLTMVNKYILLAFIVLLTIITGCSVSTKSTGTVEQVEKRRIDYTLYDLTYMEGIKQQMNGYLGDAIEKFEDAIEVNPLSDAAHYQISRIAAMRRDYENAIKYGEKAYRLDKENPWYMMHMANIYIQISKLDSAAIWLERAVRIEDKNENDKYRLGNIYMETGQEEKAEKIFEEFYNKYPGNEQIIMSLLNAKIQLGKHEETEKIIRNELEKNPNDIRMKGLLAEVYDEMGQEDKAEELYKEIMDKDKSDMAVNFSYVDFLLKNEKYSMLIDKTKDILLDKNTEKEDKIGLMARIMQDSALVNNYEKEVMDMGQQLTISYEDDPTITLLVAELYEETNNVEKAIETLAGYVEKHEEQYYVWERLLLKLNENNEVDKLYQYASKASRLFNTAPLPKILYAYSLIEKERYEEASEELRKVRILVNNEERYLVQILAMEAEIAYREGDIKGASEKFDKALDIDPENTLVLNNYAYYLAENDMRLKEAQYMIEKCLDSEENITYLDTYAWVLYKRNKYREAERIMKRIFGNASINDGELIEHYGYIQKALGRCKEAVILWQTAIKIDESKTYLVEEIRKCTEKQ